MKRGFTLIELLAVIVILAIIALIATPIVLDIINDAKESSVLRSAEFYLSGLEQTIATSLLNNKLEKDSYDIKNGDICINDDCTDKLEVEVDGEVPSEGTITITNGDITGLNIVLNEKEITKNSKGEIVYVKALEEICNLKEGTAKIEGAKYECKVDPSKKPYTFYVLNTINEKGEIISSESTDKKAVSINLIMAQNINSDGTPTTKAIKEKEKDANNGIYNLVAWVSKQDYNDDYNYLEKGNNDKGPLTALNFLLDATKNWTNTNEILINSFNSYDKEGNLTDNKIQMKTYNIYARMPYYNEVSDVSTQKMWLIDYLHGDEDEDLGIEGRENGISGIMGYWTLSARSDHTYQARIVRYDGIADSGTAEYAGVRGVRPVINLKL